MLGGWAQSGRRVEKIAGARPLTQVYWLEPQLNTKYTALVTATSSGMNLVGIGKIADILHSETWGCVQTPTQELNIGSQLGIHLVTKYECGSFNSNWLSWRCIRVFFKLLFRIQTSMRTLRCSIQPEVFFSVLCSHPRYVNFHTLKAIVEPWFP